MTPAERACMDPLDADRFNFAHDVGGIRYHLDRNTGELADCFRPRYSARAAQVSP